MTTGTCYFTVGGRFEFQTGKCRWDLPCSVPHSIVTITTLGDIWGPTGKHRAEPVQWQPRIAPPREKNNKRHDVMIPAILGPRFGEYSLLELIPSYPGFETERQMSSRAVRHRLCPRHEAT